MNVYNNNELNNLFNYRTLVLKDNIYSANKLTKSFVIRLEILYNYEINLYVNKNKEAISARFSKPPHCMAIIIYRICFMYTEEKTQLYNM